MTVKIANNSTRNDFKNLFTSVCNKYGYSLGVKQKALIKRLINDEEKGLPFKKPNVNFSDYMTGDREKFDREFAVFELRDFCKEYSHVEILKLYRWLAETLEVTIL